MKLSVLITTYNATDWLQKVLWGLLKQTHTDFEVIIADDGSGPETAELLRRNEAEFSTRGIDLRHVWQRDDGFRKCRILNKAILHARHDYLVFTDGDCILRKDFLATHAARSQPGWYLSGSYYKLPMQTSKAITRDDIDRERCFDRSWLCSQGLPSSASRLKLTRSSRLAAWMNRLTPTRCRFKGANASAWREDVVAAGGFDERMQWGGLDRELGVRLENAGIQPRLVKYDAICVHLDHSRGYKNPDMVAANRTLREQVARARITRTEHGIDALLASGYRADTDA